VAIDPERKPHHVSTSDRPMLAEAVRIVNLAQVRSRLAVDGIHE
jgi:hypothetical protein